MPAFAKKFRRAPRAAVRRLSRRILTWATGLCAGLLVSSTTSAQTTSVHATGAVTAAYTDNSLGAPEPEKLEPGEPVDPLDRGPVATPYFLLTPGAILFHDEKRSRYSLAYNHYFGIFLRAPEQNAMAESLTGQGVFVLSPRDTLTLTLDGRHSSFPALLGEPRLPAQRAGARAANDIERFNTSFTERYNRALSQAWNFFESSTFALIAPVDPDEGEPLRYSVRTETGVEYADRRSAYAVIAQGTYQRAIPPNKDAIVVTPRAALFDLSGRYRRNLSARWSAEIAGGVGIAYDFDNAPAFSPSGAGAVYFVDRVLQAGLHVGHRQTARLETFDVYQSEEAALDLTVPLSPQRRVTFSAVNGVSYDRQIDFEGAGPVASVVVWNSGLRVQWQPNWLSFGMSADHTQQMVVNDETDRLRDITSNVVMLTLAGMFPERRMAPVPIAPPVRVGAAPALQ